MRCKSVIQQYAVQISILAWAGQLRPGDVTAAARAAGKLGKKFRRYLVDAASGLEPALSEWYRDVIVDQ